MNRRLTKIAIDYENLRPELRERYCSIHHRGCLAFARLTAGYQQELGSQVLIIDCDLRKPSVHKVLGVDYTIGLSTYLSRRAELDDVIQQLPIANLSVLPSGRIPPNPAEMISSSRMKEMLALLSERYDHIIIDSPPLLKVTDP